MKPTYATKGSGVLYRRVTTLLLISLLLLEIAPKPVAAQSPSFDQQCTGTAAHATTITCSAITTSLSNDLILIGVISDGSIATPTCSGTGCPTNGFAARGSSKTQGTITEGEYYGVASGVMTNLVISMTWSGFADAVLVVETFSGVDTSNPFPNASPSTLSSGGPTPPSVTLTVTNTNEITLVGFEGDADSAANTAGTGFTLEATNTAAHGNSQVSGASEWNALSTGVCTGGCTIDFGTSATNWVIFADAIQSNTAVPDLPFGAVVLLVPVVLFYLRFRRRVSGSRLHVGSVPARMSSQAIGNGRTTGPREEACRR